MNKSIGLYIHIPFCKSKCPYCDFYSGRASENDFDNYINILRDKIILWSKNVTVPVSTIYIGGGTPSIIGSNRICKIAEYIHSYFKVAENAEFTVEVNPESGKTLDFKMLNNSGINRISIGLQSAVAEELKILGRIHNADDAMLTVKRAQESGIYNISLDLMIGVPNQTLESLIKSIEFCADCGVTHISSYILKIENGTYFGRIRDKLVLPDDDYQAEMYLTAVKHLEKLGYKQYEISNFSKPGFESKHNTGYWKCREYIGIGPSAHSFYNGKRFYYERNMSDFVNNITKCDGTGGSEEEFIMLSLRLRSGLNFREFKKKYGKPVAHDIIKKSELLAKAGYVEIDSEKISLTQTGFLVSNSIIAELI